MLFRSTPTTLWRALIRVIDCSVSFGGSLGFSDLPQPFLSRKPKKYTPDDLRRAAFAVANDVFTLGVAACLYNIPVNTLKDHVEAVKSGRVIRPRGGPDGKVPLDDQAILVRWAQLRALLRFPVSPKQLRVCAGKFAAANHTPFKRGPASRNWYNRVFWPKWKHELQSVKPSKIKPGQCALTPETLQQTYDIFVRLNEEYGLTAADWYNFDELGFDKVVGGKGKRLKGRLQSRCELFQPFTEHVTIGATIRADGARLPPYYIFMGSPTADHQADVEAQLLKGTEGTGAACTWTGACLPVA